MIYIQNWENPIWFSRVVFVWKSKMGVSKSDCHITRLYRLIGILGVQTHSGAQCLMPHILQKCPVSSHLPMESLVAILWRFLLVLKWNGTFQDDTFCDTIQLPCHSDPDQTIFHLLTKSSQYPVSCLHVWSFRGPWTLHLDGHLNTFNPSLRSPSQHFVRSPHHIFIVHPDNVNSRLRDNPVLFGNDVLDNAK